MAKYRRNREKSREIGQFLLNFNKAQNQKKGLSQNHNFEDKIKIFKAAKMQHSFRIFFSFFFFWKKNIKYLFFQEKLMHKNAIKLKVLE